MSVDFSIGDVLSLIDQTLLNPFLTAFLPVALHYFTDDKFILHPSDGLLPYRVEVSKVLYRSLLLVGVGLFLRTNRYLSSRALNNGVKASFNWDKEIIVVTGGSGGIGAEAVKRLATRGSKVVVIDVIPLTFELPRNVSYYKCDITDYKAMEATKDRIERYDEALFLLSLNGVLVEWTNAFSCIPSCLLFPSRLMRIANYLPALTLRPSSDIGAPTCVVANAGICRGKSVFAATQRDIELTFGVNNLGLLWTAKAFLPAMAARNHGHFLIIASQTGFLSTAGIVDYSATKAASLGIYEGLQTEMKHFYKAPAVRISCISPSAVKTKMFDGIKGDSNFFLPRLTPEYLGRLIADTIWSGTAQNLLTPALAYVSVPTKILPAWMRVAMQDGGSEIMTELTPHKPLA
ncbi:MAG: hypothetical protein M1818_003011 [Claussenomyces sp. TS43310]|nr:MAG: hypothetical protein M1818_003011 [Claussenomyces sp. TS43310]